MTIDGPDGYRTRDLEVGHVVNRYDDDWAVTELVPLPEPMGGVAVYLRNMDGVEGREIIAEEFMDAHVWNVVRQPDDDAHND